MQLKPRIQLPLMERKSPGYSTLNWPYKSSWSTRSLHQKPSSMKSVAFGLHFSTMAIWERLQSTNFRIILCNTWGDVTARLLRITHIEPNPVTSYDTGRGMLLQNLIILWKQGITLGSIADQNVSHLNRPTRQSQGIIVAFEGYLGLTTKGHVQRQRNSTKTLDFVVNDGTVLDLPTNRQGFINLLNDKINAKPRLTAKECSDDANRLIVTTHNCFGCSRLPQNCQSKSR